MKEIRTLPGKHYCSKKFDMRITDAKDEHKDSVAWIIYGICKKCNVVMVSDMFLQAEEPQQGIDFIIDYDKKSGKGSEWRDINKDDKVKN